MAERTTLRRWAVLSLCLAWAASIFATSSTVVTTTRLFAWFQEFVSSNPESFERFRLFWGLSWFTIVKGWHVTEFAVLALLATWAVDAIAGGKSRLNVILAALLSLAYAASDEWHQTFVPGRGGVVTDVLIDSLGVLAVSLYLLSKRKSASSAASL